jgi:elongator complex protein 2
LSVKIKSSALPQGASVPALGLSNKAVFDEDENNNSNQEKKVSLVDELYKEVYFNKIDLVKPPTEEHLLQNTLWPEVQKLYGHGYEIFAVAVDTNSKVIASACKAAKADHADIILWQEQESNGQRLYKQACSIKGHDLTVVQMRFSNDGNYLISVSRDRSWKLYKRVSSTQQNEIAFELAQFIGTKNPYHTRIIWSCDWSHDDKYFVTTSRDKRACIWEKNQDAEKVCDESKPVKCLNCENLFLELNDSITACAFSPYLTEDNR